MRFNLSVYFARQAKRPYINWIDVAVEFGVTNLCRIFTTIEAGEIISKSESLKRWRGRLPELVIDLKVRRNGPPPSLCVRSGKQRHPDWQAMSS